MEKKNNVKKEKKVTNNRKIDIVFLSNNTRVFLIIFRIHLTLERKHIKPLKLYLRELNKNNVTYN